MGSIVTMTRKNFSHLCFVCLCVSVCVAVAVGHVCLSLQAMCHGLPSFAIVLRVMKDICRRVPAWGVLNSWVSCRIHTHTHTHTQTCNGYIYTCARTDVGIDGSEVYRQC